MLGITRTIARFVLFAAGILLADAAFAQPFELEAVGAARAGYWVGGTITAPDGTDPTTVLAKFENDGTLVFGKPYTSAQGFNDPLFYEIVPLHDGGAIVVGTTTTAFGGPDTGYSLHRVDATGAPVWSLAGLTSTYFPLDNFDTQGTVLLGVDNTGGVWFPANGHIYHIDASGALSDFGQVSSSTDDTYAGAVDPASGALYFVAPSDTNLLTPGSLLRYTPGGTKATLWTAPDASTRLQFVAVGSDGNVYAIGNNASTHIAMSFSPSGTVRWSAAFGSSLYAFSNTSDIATQAAAFADGSIVALDNSGALFHVSTTGQVQQVPDSAYQQGPFGGGTLVETTRQGDIVLYTSGGTLLRLSATGQVLTNISTLSTGLPTVLSDGTILIAALTPGGAILQHLDRNGQYLPSTPDLGAISLAAPTQIRVDQSGLDGAWYVSAESGQGFTIDYIAADNVLFIPWFTYSVDASNDPSGLAWVTFQGSPTSGATSATLQIARTAPGTFNSGKVSGQAIGTAVLTATDCSNARLQYQFNAGEFGGLGGYMPLVRIAPSTTPCIGANGQTTPPQNANAPLHGFDANQSGSWFDPNTAGQGFEFTIIPAGNGFSGLVFGAWFTFDAPPADDSLHQHWFTLQGDMSTALDGTVTLPILQSFGGSLDSLPSTGYSQVGTATLSMLSCTSATLVYQFDNSAAAKNFAGLSGTINLSKIGGCTAP